MLLFKHAPPLKKLPAAMIVVVMGVVVSWAMELGETHGFKIAGDIPTGIPVPATPAWPPSQHFGQIITLSVVTTMIGYMESVAVGMVYAGRNGYEIGADQELVAMGLANLAGSFFSCFQTAGGFGPLSLSLCIHLSLIHI